MSGLKEDNTVNNETPGTYACEQWHAIARRELARVETRLFIDEEFRDSASGGKCVDSILIYTRQKSAWLRPSE